MLALGQGAQTHSGHFFGILNSGSEVSRRTRHLSKLGFSGSRARRAHVQVRGGNDKSASHATHVASNARTSSVFHRDDLEPFLDAIVFESEPRLLTKWL